jgi:methylglutaconyl-CoA hydratase
MKTIRYDLATTVAVITLSRPDKRNALNPQMISELTETFAHADADERCRVVLLKAEGPVFSAGMDLDVLQRMTAQPYEINLEDARRFGELLRRVWTLGKPVISVVGGPALAGGCGLVALGDFTLATPDATFGLTEVKIGAVPAISGVFLRRLIGEKRARELMLSGRLLGAVEAQQIGLVTELVAPDKIELRAREIAGQLIANSPRAITTTRRGLGVIPLDELERACIADATARATADCREGVQALLEKRKPRWS